MRIPIDSRRPAPPKLGAASLILGAALIVGVALRLFHLTQQSYWYDEVFSWDTSSLPIPKLLAAVIADGSHPPLHYLMLHEWLKLFRWGDDAASGRVFTVLFGVACLPVLYGLGRELYDRWTASVAVLLLAVSQLGIAYSQEVRPYSQLILFILATVLFYVRAVSRRSLAFLIAAGICAILALGTHYYASLTLAALGLWHLAYARRSLPIAWIALVVGVAVAAALPWLLSGVVQSGLREPSTISAAQPFYFAVNWNTPFENLAAFGDARSGNVVSPAGAPLMIFLASALFSGPALLMLRGPWSRAPAPRWVRDLSVVALAAGIGAATSGIEWALIGAVLVAVWLGLQRLSAPIAPRLPAVGFLALVLAAAAFARFASAPAFACFLLGVLAAEALSASLASDGPAETDDRYTVLLTLLVSTPLVLLLLLGERGVKYDIRYAIGALAPFYLLAARGMMRLKRTSVRVGWIAATLAFSLLGVRNVLAVPYKEDYRDALAVIHRDYRPGECVSFLVPGDVTPPQWRLYRYDDVAIRIVTKAQLAAGAPDCQALWLLEYQRVSSNAAAAAAWTAMVARRRPVIETRQFKWMEVTHLGPLVAPPPGRS